MKQGMLEILGKTITGVVVKEREETHAAQNQVFILFSDGTYYELYGARIEGIGHLREGGKEDVREYMSSGKIVLEGHIERLSR
ncbi:MAG: hypothetical protein WBX15_01630 [Thermoanaerobaculia bacterium]